MMRILALAFLTTLCVCSNAQIRFGVKAGYSNSSAIYDQPYDISEGKSINGFQAGLFAEKKIIRSISLSSDMLFTQKGNYADYTSKIAAQDHYDVRTYRLNYIEADIAVSYRLKAGRRTAIRLGLGPYAAFGISGKETGYYYWFGNSGNIDRKVKFKNEKATEFNQTNFSPVEWGVNFKTSIQYRKYFLYITYGRGIGARVLEKYAGNTSGNEFGYYEQNTKNQVLSIGLGYYLK